MLDFILKTAKKTFENLVLLFILGMAFIQTSIALSLLYSQAQIEMFSVGLVMVGVYCLLYFPLLKMKNTQDKKMLKENTLAINKIGVMCDKIILNNSIVTCKSPVEE